LKICLNIFSQDLSQRPTGFQTAEGDGFVMITLERVKKR
jgi:hypothetical protein